MAPAPAGKSGIRDLAVLLLLTLIAMLVLGYHPGLEDDAFYLAAIKRNLNPALFPHDADFFRLQFQATIFDKLIAASIRMTHLPLDWAVLLWQIASIYLILWGCRQIARRCFAETPAQWAAVTLVALLLTIPVSGTAIDLADQYLHPRNLATAAIVCAIVATLDRRFVVSGLLLAFAFANHAIMASFGISFCLFLGWQSSADRMSSSAVAALFLPSWLPLGWLFAPASDAWRRAASTRSFYYLNRWAWYEWLGVFGPVAILWLFRWIAKRNGSAVLERFTTRLVYFAIFQTAVGLTIMLPPQLERLRPFEPMRYLHLVYLLFFLIAGGLLGRYALGRHIYRWVLVFVPLGLGMFYAQRQLYPASLHLELPGRSPQNDWLNAFVWVRENTTVDSLFALDPRYMQLPGEDFHGFRALAERSALADFIKDGGMAARVPSLAPRWLREVSAIEGWRNFQAVDFEKLRQEFGVDWVVLARPGVAGLACPYQNRSVLVCRLGKDAVAR
ncbi:MAG: hypothetical protein WAL71_16050 [Terriglobales bacterium]|jgi:hypothetical protein